MNDNERFLLRYICEGNYYNARQQAKLILRGIRSKTDEGFREELLTKLTKQEKWCSIPANLQGILIAEDSTDFPVDRFLLRSEEKIAVSKTLDLYHAAEKLSALRVPVLPAIIRYGQSGCGKTELARYIAHKANLPFVYVRFSNLVESQLGKTQANIARIFDYVKIAPCVLCFDELDAIGLSRGQNNDVGEMNRIVITLMQELDRMPNNVIVVGTTNRYDRLDAALIRRFSLQYEIRPLSQEEAIALARKFFSYAGQDPAIWDEWSIATFNDSMPASSVIRDCTEKIVSTIINAKK